MPPDDIQEWSEQIPGIGSVTDAILRRRRGLGRMLYDIGGGEQPSSQSGVPDEEQEPRLMHRITDDQQAGNRSGGPAGGYVDPGRGHLADLIEQERKLSQPSQGEPLKNRLLRAITQAGTIGASAAFGGMGGPEGADAAINAGTARRHQQQDLAETRRQSQRQTLQQEIEQERRAAEQREAQYGLETRREGMQQEGMNLRERIAQEAETGRATRLADTIKAQGERQQAGAASAQDLERLRQEGRESLEDQKQVGRMELQRARANAQAAIANMRQSMRNIPGPVAKSFDSFQDSQSRMDVMQDAYDKAIKTHDQQAMLNLLANHLGMTMGLQKGSRLTRDIIREAQKSGYLDERIEAHFDDHGYMTGVVLTPRQMSQMVDLAKVRLVEDARKVTDMETYFNVRGGMAARPRIPGEGTAHPEAAGGRGGGTGAAQPGSPGELKPPGPAHPGMKWQHRIANGKVEWRMVQDKQ